MKKENITFDVIDFIIAEDSDGWALIGVIDYFNNHFWYEIKTPKNTLINYISSNIYEAIDKLNREKEKYKKE